MSPYTIKNIDYFFGKPICLLLTIYDWIRKIIIRDNALTEVKKIVFIKLVEQGATVLAYPTLKRAEEIVGRQNIFFCVFKENRPILDILEIVPRENIFEIRKDNLFLFTIDMLSFFIKCRQLKIDTAIDMEFFSRASAIICYMTGASKRVGYHRYTCEYPYRGNLMTHRIQYNPYIHVSKAYMILVESLSLAQNEIPKAKIIPEEIMLRFANFSPSHEEVSKIKRMLADFNYKKIIILNPNASDMLPLRKWDTGNFIGLARMILDNYSDVIIVLTGSPSEQRDVEDIKMKIGSERVVNFAGRTTMRELLTLYSIADLIVTNDSGPGHFASLTSIHTIVLFGPETPILFGPIGKNVSYVYKKLACSPCVNVFNHRFSPCHDNVCMKSITVGMVFDLIKGKMSLL